LGNNTFTELFADGSALTQSQLETALQSLKLDISNTTQLTSGTSAGQFLKSAGDGIAVTWGSTSDPLGPFAIRNYGLSASVSTGSLTVALKTNALSNPSGSDVVDIPFSNAGSSSATYTPLTVTGALSFTITASGTLGFTGTSTNRVYLYAINNGGTVKLAASARSDLDNGVLVSTTMMSSGADSATVLYATAALSVVPRLLGFVESALNSSSQWQAPTRCGVTNNIDLRNQLAINALANAVTRATGTTVAAGGVALSASCGPFSTGNLTLTDVTNLSVTITTSGRPVRITCIDDGSGNVANISSGSQAGFFSIIRDSTQLTNLEINTVPGSLGNNMPPSSINHIDFVAAGTYTYKLQAAAHSGSGGTVIAQYIKLCVHEL
jgi:hypothetical protein